MRFASRESIGRSKITIGTCVSLGSLYNLGFPKNHFTHIIIDEAGQSMEPEVLIPLGTYNQNTRQIIIFIEMRCKIACRMDLNEMEIKI